MPESGDLTIRELRRDDLAAVKEFTDRAIGRNYYSLDELERIFERSLAPGGERPTMCSLVLENAAGGIQAIRITYPPGRWEKGKGKGLSPTLWDAPFAQTAYFQSLFVDPALTGQGWGKRLSERAIEILRGLGAAAIVCHSWKESPHDSSGRYLRGLGFRTVATHPLYWKDVDYVCTRCGKPCLCTAEEMILPLG